MHHSEDMKRLTTCTVSQGFCMFLNKLQNGACFQLLCIFGMMHYIINKLCICIDPGPFYTKIEFVDRMQAHFVGFFWVQEQLSYRQCLIRRRPCSALDIHSTINGSYTNSGGAHTCCLNNEFLLWTRICDCYDNQLSHKIHLYSLLNNVIYYYIVTCMICVTNSTWNCNKKYTQN